MQKKYFIAQESSRYSVRKQDCFFFLFVYIKTFRKKHGFVYMIENYDDCHHRKITRTLIYTKSKTIETFYIQKPDTFQKARQFQIRFYIQKAIHLTLRDFHETFEFGIYIKIMTLCVT